ncbi:helix-turn-helix transcriptional regulator [Rhizobium laguerreae]|uniref:helix-turn-helix transcriptional regulator n=1 Tax=Rhizobium laguerreae TaxID=1076926 RepID=UPI001C91CFF5|nr:helix-turn-helix transcriptional regulator [Rhizobium laguerreae]MBY3201337.1 helix-turn-helix transcriptional regulator [Rhizobium laguerreae]
MNHDWIYPKIGNLIRRRRKQLDMRQADLAPKVGMSRASLANIETGRQNLLVHQIYALAQALKMEPKDLLPAPEFAADPSELPLPDGLTENQQQQIAQLLMGSSSSGGTDVR